MDEDNDAPPMLVEADGPNTDAAEATLSADMEDLKITRVPITIITGRCVFCVNFSNIPAPQSSACFPLTYLQQFAVWHNL